MTRFIDWWQNRIGYDSPQRCVLDAAGILLVGSLLIGFGLDNEFSFPALGLETQNMWWRLATLVPMCILVVAKAWRPQAALAAGSVVFVVDLAFGNGIGVTIAIFDLILAAASRSSARQHRRIGYMIFASTSLATVAAASVSKDPRLTLVVMLLCLALLVTPYSWGSIVRKQAELMAIAEERAKDAAQMAQLQRVDAIHSERSRMARDLHDSLAGSLAAVAVNAEAALTLSKRDGTDARVRASMHAIRESSVSALREMHTMIEVLRRDGTDAVFAPPRLREIDNLVNVLTTAGHDIEVTSDHIDDLPAAVSQSAYRILQESLHNAVKHSNGGAIKAHIQCTAAALTITVTNDFSAHPDRSVKDSHGIGLASMRERAEALGGTFTSGPNDALSQWRMEAHLPLSCEAQPVLAP